MNSPGITPTRSAISPPELSESQDKSPASMHDPAFSETMGTLHSARNSATSRPHSEHSDPASNRIPGRSSVDQMAEQDKRSSQQSLAIHPNLPTTGKQRQEIAGTRPDSAITATDINLQLGDDRLTDDNLITAELSFLSAAIPESIAPSPARGPESSPSANPASSRFSTEMEKTLTDSKPTILRSLSSEDDLFVQPEETGAVSGASTNKKSATGSLSASDTTPTKATNISIGSIPSTPLESPLADVTSVRMAVGNNDTNLDTSRVTLTSPYFTNPAVSASGEISETSSSTVEFSLKPGWEKRMEIHVRQMIQQGPGQMTLRLNPAELGNLEIQVKLDQQQAHLSFSSPHSYVRELIDNQLSGLRQAFLGNSVQLGQVDIHDSQTSQSGHGFHEHTPHEGSTHGDETDFQETETGPQTLGFIPQGRVDYFI